MKITDIFNKIDEIMSTIRFTRVIPSQESNDEGVNQYRITRLNWVNSIDFKVYNFYIEMQFSSIEDFINLYDDTFEHEMLNYFTIESGEIDDDKNMLDLKITITC